MNIFITDSNLLYFDVSISEVRRNITDKNL